jgi:hypothetical protein
MSTADDPREADLTTLGFGIGTLSYQCGGCGRIAKIDSYPLLMITGFLSAFFIFFLVPLLFKIYPDFGHATLFTAVLLLNLKLIFTFLHLLYENIVYPGIERWSKVIAYGAVAIAAAVPSAFPRRLL